MVQIHAGQPIFLSLFRMGLGTNIVLVEDDEDAVVLLKHAFELAGVAAPVHVFRDGDEAILYLRERAETRQALPSIVIVDVKLPTKSGHEILLWAKDHPICRAIPILVHSSTNDPLEITRAYSLGAACYVVKPSSFMRLVEVAKAIKLLWLETEDH